MDPESSAQYEPSGECNGMPLLTSTSALEAQINSMFLALTNLDNESRSDSIHLTASKLFNMRGMVAVKDFLSTKVSCSHLKLFMIGSHDSMSDFFS